MSHHAQVLNGSEDILSLPFGSAMRFNTDTYNDHTIQEFRQVG